MCRQETTVKFWDWKAVKDRNQATELRPVSAGQHHCQLCGLCQARGGEVEGGRWVDMRREGGHTRR